MKLVNSRQIASISSTMKTSVQYIVTLCFWLVHCSLTFLPYDTIIVGLGSSGTTAASTLAKAGKRVLALEAQDRVGGRVYSVPYRNGMIELGAEWIQGTNNSQVYEAAVKHNIGVVLQDKKVNIFVSDDSRVNASFFRNLVKFCLKVPEEYPPEEPESIGSLLTREFKEHIKKNHPDLLRDENFVKNFLEFMNNLVSNSQAANDWTDVSTESKFVEIDGHQYISWHRYGYDSFFKILLNTYNNGPGWPTLDIKLNKEVTLIKWSKRSTGNVEVVCKDGDVFTADNVIVTVSLGVLKERYSDLFLPPLPEEKITAIEKTSMGVLNKIVLCFEEEWLPRGTWFYFFWEEEEKKQINPEDLWITKIMTCSTTLGSKESLTFWTNSDVARLIETLPADVVITKLMDILIMFMGKNYTIPEPVSIMIPKWFSNPFTRGSFSYDSLSVHEYPETRATLGEPLVDETGVPKVLFAGEATSEEHYATVHGASETGLREAHRLLSDD